MKKLLLKSFLFIIPLAMFFVYMEVNLAKIPNSYSFKRECFEQQLDSIEVLVLGSSQMVHGVNPDYFSMKGFNLSNVSQTLFYDSRITLRYLDRMPKLKYALINISYFSFGEQLIDGREAWRDYYYSQYWNIDYPEIEKMDIKKYSKTFLYTPTHAFGYFLKGFHVNLIENYDRSGFSKVDTIEKSYGDSTGYIRVQTHEDCYQEKRVAENQKYVEELIVELKKRNITPVIITPPVLETYSKFVNKEKVKRNTEIVNRICKKYNCRYFDYFSDKRFVQSDFCDNDHLNVVGAEKFSRVIDKEILGSK